MGAAARDDGGAARHVAEPAAPRRERRVAAGVEAAHAPPWRPSAASRASASRGDVVELGEERRGVEAGLAQRLPAPVGVVRRVRRRCATPGWRSGRGTGSRASRAAAAPCVQKRAVASLSASAARWQAECPRENAVRRSRVDRERARRRRRAGARPGRRARARRPRCGSGRPGARRSSSPTQEAAVVVERPGEAVEHGGAVEEPGVARLVGPAVVERVEGRAVDDDGDAAVGQRRRRGAPRPSPSTAPRREVDPGVEAQRRGRRRGDVGRRASRRAPSSRGPSQRTSSCAIPGVGVALLDAHAQHAQHRGVVERPVAVERAAARAPTTTASTASSSRSSRTSACAGSSPGSTLPPGQLPAAGQRRGPGASRREQPAARARRRRPPRPGGRRRSRGSAAVTARRPAPRGPRAPARARRGRWRARRRRRSTRAGRSPGPDASGSRTPSRAYDPGTSWRNHAKLSPPSDWSVSTAACSPSTERTTPGHQLGVLLVVDDRRHAAVVPQVPGGGGARHHLGDRAFDEARRRVPDRVVRRTQGAGQLARATGSRSGRRRCAAIPTRASPGRARRRCAASDRRQLEGDARRLGDQVDGQVRARGVAARPVQLEGHLVGGARDRAARAGRRSRCRAWGRSAARRPTTTSVEPALGDDVDGAAGHGLLGGLEHAGAPSRGCPRWAAAARARCPRRARSRCGRRGRTRARRRGTCER